MISAIALLAALPASAPVAAEPHTVATLRNVVLRDESRRRNIPLFITYPSGSGGPYPVIVFSHGAGGAGPNVAGLTSEWSARGYVCVNPSHQDVRRREEEGGAILSRVQDIKHILGSWDRLAEQQPELKGKLDPAKLGIAGHSLGALTAQLLAAASGDAGDQSDQRPKAFILLSPQGVGQHGFVSSSWAALSRPMLSVTGALDRGAQGQGPEWRMDPFRLSPEGDKFHLFFEGGHHGSFTGRYAGPATGTRGDTRQAEIFEQVKEVTTAFWDAYLKDSATAKRKLASWSAEGATLSRR